MRSNNRQRSRGGRNGGGGGGGGHHHKQHHNNPNRPPNRNQIFDSSGPDVRVRGNAHQVFDKYQALAREADELATLAASVRPDVHNLSRGILAKDLAQKLKQIEKLSKHLRSEVTR